MLCSGDMGINPVIIYPRQKKIVGNIFLKNQITIITFAEDILCIFQICKFYSTLMRVKVLQIIFHRTFIIFCLIDGCKIIRRTRWTSGSSFKPRIAHITIIFHSQIRLRPLSPIAGLSGQCYYFPTSLRSVGRSLLCSRSARSQIEVLKFPDRSQPQVPAL